jgi:triosephosphate isomerase
VAVAREIAAEVGRGVSTVDVVVAPPFTALPAVGQALAGTAVALAGQNLYWEREGAYTGEVSPLMLRDVGCTHVILGHSERRQLFAESDEGVARKTAAALTNGLVPIVCVGETLEERESGRTLEVLERQGERALRVLSPDQVAGLIVAYEPVWAIGTGRTATPAEAQEAHAFLRKRLAASHGEPVALATRILYGGSVKPDNIGPLMAQPDIDGALVGGASLSAASFLKIVRYPPA